VQNNRPFKRFGKNFYFPNVTCCGRGKGSDKYDRRIYAKPLFQFIHVSNGAFWARAETNTTLLYADDVRWAQSSSRRDFRCLLSLPSNVTVQLNCSEKFHALMQQSAREDFIKFCRRKSFKTYSFLLPLGVRRRNWKSQRCEGIKSTRRSFCQNVCWLIVKMSRLFGKLSLVFLISNRSIHCSYQSHYFWALRIRHYTDVTYH
jgi:hypothetical protein